MEDKLLNNGEPHAEHFVWVRNQICGAFTIVSKYVNFEPANRRGHGWSSTSKVQVSGPSAHLDLMEMLRLGFHWD